jgi:transposase
LLSLHRDRFIEARTAQSNQIRGLLGGYGLVVVQGIAHIAQQRAAAVLNAENLQVARSSALPVVNFDIRAPSTCGAGYWPDR